MLHFRKQPWEKFLVRAGFTKWLAAGETIDGVASSVIGYDNAGNDVSSQVLQGNHSVAGPKLVQTVKGGEDGETYKLTFRAITSAGNQLELDILMLVRET